MSVTYGEHALQESVPERSFYGPLVRVAMERWNFAGHDRALYHHPTDSSRYIRKDAELDAREAEVRISQISEYAEMLDTLQEEGVAHVKPSYSHELSDTKLTVYAEVDRINGISLENFGDFTAMADELVQEVDTALLGILGYLRRVARTGGMASAETLAIRQFMFDLDTERLVLVDVDPIFGWYEPSLPLAAHTPGNGYSSLVYTLEGVAEDTVKLQSLTDVPLQSTQRAQELVADAHAATGNQDLAMASKKLRQASR